MIDIDITLPLAPFPLSVRTSLPEGITAVMGPSGSGKTSLLETVAGLRRQALGRITAGGEVLLDTGRGIRLPPERRRVGYVPQDAGLFPHLSVIGNVRFGARGDTRRVDGAIETLEIGHLLTRRVRTLSGGERQRVSLARALATDPRMLLLDEPLASLDIRLRERLMPFLGRIRDEWKVPVLYVTHNVGEAHALAGHAVLLHDGTIQAQGKPIELLSGLLGEIRTDPDLAREAEEGVENLLAGRVTEHDPAGGISRVALDGGPSVAIPLAAGRAAGERVILAIRAEDLLVSLDSPRDISARNVFTARIERLHSSGSDVILRCALGADPRQWLVRLTPAAVSALRLEAGRNVWLSVKSHSIRVL